MQGAVEVEEAPLGNAAVRPPVNRELSAKVLILKTLVFTLSSWGGVGAMTSSARLAPFGLPSDVTQSAVTSEDIFPVDAATLPPSKEPRELLRSVPHGPSLTGRSPSGWRRIWTAAIVGGDGAVTGEGEGVLA